MVANDLNMVNSNFSWILVTKENLLPSLDIPCYSERVNISFHIVFMFCIVSSNDIFRL